jgi:transcriptional regulator with XRE-family HTH domain
MDKNKNTFLKKLGVRIAYLREKNGLSQTELANECEKDRQSINRVEKGNVNPSAYFLFQIAQALKIPVKDLLDI